LNSGEPTIAATLAGIKAGYSSARFFDLRLNPEEIRAIQKSTQSTEEFISKTLLDAVRVTLTPEALLAIDLTAAR
jgi:hypothetical protein